MARSRKTGDDSQDGQRMVSAEAGNAEAIDAKTGPEPVVEKASSPSEVVPPRVTEGDENAVSTHPNAPTVAVAPGLEGQSVKRVDHVGRGASTALAANKARKTIQRATTAARDKLEDNVRPRVEKIRQASSVVLEEAHYDPSVRFILVAAALFGLFVVLLIISKII